MPDLSEGVTAPWVTALAGTDTLVHLAAALPWTTRNRAMMHQINVEGTLTLAEAAIAAGVRRIVFISTLGVHGISSGDTPFTPQSPIAPSGLYAMTKHEAEMALGTLCAAAGIALVILRPPVVYGAGVSGKVGTLVRLTARGARLPLGRITGNRRQMIAVDNLADAVLLAARHPHAPGTPLLPADAQSLSTFGLLDRLARLQGQPLRLMPVPEAMLRRAVAVPGIGAYADRLVGNVEIRDARLQNDLGWHPPCTLDEALTAMVHERKRS